MRDDIEWRDALKGAAIFIFIFCVISIPGWISIHNEESQCEAIGGKIGPAPDAISAGVCSPASPGG